MATLDKLMQELQDATLEQMYPALGEDFEEKPRDVQTHRMVQEIAKQMDVRPSWTDGKTLAEANNLLRETLQSGVPSQKMRWQPAKYRRTKAGWRD